MIRIERMEKTYRDSTGWEFALLLFTHLSKSLIYWATVSNSLSSLFKKERLWTNCSCRSLPWAIRRSIVTKEGQWANRSRRSRWVLYSWFEQIDLKNGHFARKKSKKIIFFEDFDSFSLLFPFLCPRANRSCCSFLKSNGSTLLTPLFTKERLWAIRSGHSWQKSNGSD